MSEAVAAQSDIDTPFPHRVLLAEAGGRAQGSQIADEALLDGSSFAREASVWLHRQSSQEAGGRLSVCMTGREDAADEGDAQPPEA